jgi:hypothetical protein
MYRLGRTALAAIHGRTEASAHGREPRPGGLPARFTQRRFQKGGSDEHVVAWMDRGAVTRAQLLIVLIIF